jgi:hypothetical protein
MMTVFATREGLPGGKTASGYRVESVVPFVALPSFAALRQWVRVTNPANGKTVRALVLDVGPWNEHDDAYVFAGARPLAERGIGQYRHATNAAGIDLGEAVWRALEMTDNANVSWEFEI